MTRGVSYILEGGRELVRFKGRTPPFLGFLQSPGRLCLSLGFNLKASFGLTHDITGVPRGSKLLLGTIPLGQPLFVEEAFPEV